MLTLIFHNAGVAPPPPTGQTPSASRYRKGARVNYVNLWWLIVGVIVGR